MFIFSREAWLSMVGLRRLGSTPVEQHVPLFVSKVRSSGSRNDDLLASENGLSLFVTPQMLPDSHSDAHCLLCARQTHRSTVGPSAFAGSSQSLGPASGR